MGCLLFPHSGGHLSIRWSRKSRNFTLTGIYSKTTISDVLKQREVKREKRENSLVKMLTTSDPISLMVVVSYGARDYMIMFYSVDILSEQFASWMVCRLCCIAVSRKGWPTSCLCENLCFLMLWFVKSSWKVQSWKMIGQNFFLTFKQTNQICYSGVATVAFYWETVPTAAAHFKPCPPSKTRPHTFLGHIVYISGQRNKQGMAGQKIKWKCLRLDMCGLLGAACSVCFLVFVTTRRKWAVSEFNGILGLIENAFCSWLQDGRVRFHSWFPSEPAAPQVYYICSPLNSF